MKITEGIFFALAGGEGSGKGTISDHLRSIYTGRGVHFTREPGGVPLSEKLRTMLKEEYMVPLTELLLFEAARSEHLAQLVIPALARGVHVISDRFDACTFAYQVCGRWNGGFEELFRNINDHVVTRRPDVYIFCDILPEIALERRKAAGEIDRFDQEDIAFHTRVYEGYKKFFADPKNGRSIHIDTTQPREAMLAEVETIMKRELGF